MIPPIYLFLHLNGVGEIVRNLLGRPLYFESVEHRKEGYMLFVITCVR